MADRTPFLSVIFGRQKNNQPARGALGSPVPPPLGLARHFPRNLTARWFIGRATGAPIPGPIPGRIRASVSVISQRILVPETPDGICRITSLGCREKATRKIMAWGLPELGGDRDNRGRGSGKVPGDPSSAGRRAAASGSPKQSHVGTRIDPIPYLIAGWTIRLCLMPSKICE
jgi:hypothetical protein